MFILAIFLYFFLAHQNMRGSVWIALKKFPNPFLWKMSIFFFLKFLGRLFEFLKISEFLLGKFKLWKPNWKQKLHNDQVLNLPWWTLSWMNTGWPSTQVFTFTQRTAVPVFALPTAKLYHFTLDRSLENFALGDLSLEVWGNLNISKIAADLQLTWRYIEDCENIQTVSPICCHVSITNVQNELWIAYVLGKGPNKQVH